jgi:hypothetical protein
VRSAWRTDYVSASRGCHQRLEAAKHVLDPGTDLAGDRRVRQPTTNSKISLSFSPNVSVR